MGRLDSWKAIAGYLGRDVRSAQRWESERGLPVYRIPGAKGGGVFAYTEELDAWLHGRSDDGNRNPAEETPAQVNAPLTAVQPAAENAVSSDELAISHHLSAAPVRFALISLLVMVLLATAGFVFWRRSRKTVASSPRRPMLLVLPFMNLSGDASQDYFADGLTEELITQVGRLDPAELGVIARTSSMHYKRTNEDIAQIGRDLGVNYVIEGSVRRHQGLSRISVQLIQVRDQTHLWAQSYEASMAQVVDVERQVAAAVADKVRVRLLAHSQAGDTEAETAWPEAFDNYLEGQYFANQRRMSGLTQAIKFFHRAIEIDPNYDAAYAGLAQCYTLLAIDAVSNPEEMERNARAAAAKAVALNDSSAQAHVILAGTKVLFDFDWVGAKADFDRALTLNPNNALAHHWYANLYLEPNGRYQEAIAEMKIAQQLDPLSLIINTDLGYAYYVAGDGDAALAQFHKVLEMDPDFVPAHYDLAMVYTKRGMYAEAVRQLVQDMQISGHGDQAANLLAIYDRSGYRGVEKAVVAGSDGKPVGMRPSFTSAAEAHLFLGEVPQAISCLQSAYRNREAELIYLKADPVWSGLRSDAEFQNIERKLGLIQ